MFRFGLFLDGGVNGTALGGMELSRCPTTFVESLQVRAVEESSAQLRNT